MSDAVLRGTWTYKLSSHLRHNEALVFGMAALEVLRRFQWSFFRVETEQIRREHRQRMQASSPDGKGHNISGKHGADEEMEELLEKT